MPTNPQFSIDDSLRFQPFINLSNFEFSVKDHIILISFFDESEGS